RRVQTGPFGLKWPGPAPFVQLTHGGAAQRGRCRRAIEILQPGAREAAVKIDIAAPARALDAPASEDRQPAAFAIHRDTGSASPAALWSRWGHRQRALSPRARRGVAGGAPQADTMSAVTIPNIPV